MKKRFDFSDIDSVLSMKQRDIVNMSSEDLELLYRRLKEMTSLYIKALHFVSGAILFRYKQHLLSVIHNTNVGTQENLDFSVLDDGVEVSFSVPIERSWDSKLLGKLARQIFKSGGNPEEFLRVVYQVSDYKYSTLSEQMRERIDSARRVVFNYGRMTIKMTPNKSIH